MTSPVYALPLYPVFHDLAGKPLEAGYIYIGVPGANAEASPLQVYWDEDQTIPIAQPIRTIAGYPSRNGSPGALYVAGDYSITVRDRDRVLVYSALEGVNFAEAATAEAQQAAADAEAALEGAVDLVNMVVNVLPIERTATGDGTIDTLVFPGVFTEKKRFYDVSIGGVAQTPDDFALSNNGVQTTMTFVEPFPIGAIAVAKVMQNLSLSAPSVLSFADRAAVIGWIGANPTPPVGTVLAWNGVAVRYIGSGVVIPDMPGYVPDGVATPVHYGMTLNTDGASRTANTAALVACVTNHDYTWLPSGLWPCNGPINLRGLDRRTLEGATYSGIQIYGTGVNGLEIGTDDKASTEYKGLKFRMRGISVQASGNSAATTGSALWIEHSSGCDIRDCSFGGFWNQIRVTGGQHHDFDGIRAYGRANVSNRYDDSSIFWIENFRTTGGTLMRNFCTWLSNFDFSGINDGVTGLTHDLFRLEAGDDFSARGGYIARASRALAYIRIKDESHIAQINISDLYLDGTRYDVGSPHDIYVDTATGTGRISRLKLGPGLSLANATDDSLFVAAGSNLKRLIFDNAIISGGLGKAANISGSSLLEVTGKLRCYSMAGGFYLDTANTFDLEANFSECSDATAAVSLSGVIETKRHALTFTDCAAGLVDTSTGQTSFARYEWEKSFPLVTGPGVQSSVTDTGAGKLLIMGAWGGNGSTQAPEITDLTGELPAGQYRIMAGNAATCGGPDTAPHEALVKIGRGSSGYHYYEYQRASSSVSRSWRGFRAGTTGAISWFENAPEYIPETAFTPELRIGGVTTGITYSSRSASYSKSGAVVTFKSILILSSKGGLTGSVEIWNLPFPTTSNGTPLPVRYNNLSTAGLSVYADIVSASTKIRLTKMTSGGTSLAVLDGTDISNTFNVTIGGSYLV